METKAHYALVGFFALSLAAAAAVFTVWLGQLRFDREFDEYEIVFTDGARGLRDASEVQFNGIKVGEVIEVGLPDPDADWSGPDGGYRCTAQNNCILARIRIASRTPVDCRTLGQLEPLGLTGVNFVQLVPVSGEDHARYLSEAERVGRSVFNACEDVNARPARIRGERSQIDTLIEGSGGVLSESQALLLRLATLLERNEESLTAIVADVEQVTDTVAANDQRVVDEVLAAVANLNETIDQIGEAADNVGDTADSVGELADQATALVRDDLRPMMTEVDETIGAFRRTAANAESLIADSRGPALESAEQLPVAIGELRALIARLDAIAAEIEEDPGGFIAGPRRRELEIPQ